MLIVANGLAHPLFNTQTHIYIALYVDLVILVYSSSQEDTHAHPWRSALARY